MQGRKPKEAMSREEYAALFENPNVDWHDLKTADEDLANAIVETACNSYISYRVSQKAPLPKNHELYRFFYSQWYEALTNIDADYLIRKLDEKAEMIREKNEEERLKKLEKQKMGESSNG